MILSDTKIDKQFIKGKISIRPFNIGQLKTNSYDCTLSNKLIRYKGTGGNNDKAIPVPIDPKQDLEARFEEFTIPEEGFIIYPWDFYLGLTNEIVGSNKYYTRCANKSSVRRMGLSICSCAGSGEVGFIGKWVLELKADVPIIVYPNMPICQIVFEKVSGKIKKAYNKDPESKYINQDKIMSRYHLNFIK